MYFIAIRTCAGDYALTKNSEGTLMLCVVLQMTTQFRRRQTLAPIFGNAKHHLSKSVLAHFFTFVEKLPYLK